MSGTNCWVLPQVEGLGPGGRGGHACVAIGSKVLLFGGSDRAPVTYDDLWVLDTGEQELHWTRITPTYASGCKVMPRSGASLTVVGKLVCLFGGQEPVTEFRFGDVKILDTETWTWSDVQVVSSANPPPRHSHTAVCLADQCVLVYGGSGYSGSLSDVWIFNTAQCSWTQVKTSGDSAPPAREMHCAAMVTNTTMMIYGGRGSDGSILSDVALLDVSSGKWIASEQTPFPRCAHCCAALPLPSTSSTSIQGGSPEPCPDSQPGDASASGHEDGGSTASASLSPSQCMLVYGGFSGQSVEGDILQFHGQSLEVEQLHVGPRPSDRAGSVPSARFAAAAAPLLSWRSGPALCVFGGVNPEQDLNDVIIWKLGKLGTTTA